MIGKTLAHYQVTALVGSGGMGEVYRARDTKLARDVALKVLPREVSSDVERAARFEREARTLAALQHPNVASIYGYEDVDGTKFLVMELVEGEDLAQQLARGPFSGEETIRIAKEIALGLEAAHERGIIHRDLKPANVKVDPNGQVKILDFGLARAYAGTVESDEDPSMSPTITAAMTQAGALLGTAAYMSPEQARGKTVDKRADIWAFGCVLYEMVSGGRPFEGETISDTLAAVLRAEPPRDGLSGSLPLALVHLIDRCLEKDPRRRLRDIGEAVILLDDLQSGKAPTIPVVTGQPAAVASRSRERVLWGLALLAAVALGVVTTRLTNSPPPPEGPLRKLTLDVGHELVSKPIISPDGRYLAFIDEEDLWIQSFRETEPRLLASGVNALFRPVWSPRSDAIAFVRNPDLVRTSIAGGAVTPICAVPNLSGGAGGTWNTDGRIFFTIGEDNVYEVAAGGGLAKVHTAVFEPTDVDIHEPHVLPDGHSLLVVRHRREYGPVVLSMIRDGTFIDLDTVSSSSYWSPLFDPRGYVIVTRLGGSANGLWAIPVAPDASRLAGEPFLIAAGASSPSLTRDGTLAYVLGDEGIATELVTIDRNGEVVTTWPGTRGTNDSFSVSPDATKAAITISADDGRDLWIYDLQRTSKSRFAFGPGSQSHSCWSPDGGSIAYESQRRLWIRPADGSTEPRYLGIGRFPAITPDGERVTYSVSPDGGSDLWIRSLTDLSDSTLILGTPAEEWSPSLSRNGRFLLYSSDESGTREVYLRDFPGGSRRWQVSSDGGSRQQWSPSGDTIYYISEGRFFEVTVVLEPAVELSTPEFLFRLDDKGLQEWGTVPIRPLNELDRFMALKLSDVQERSNVVIVDNWVQEFESSP